LGPVRGDYKKKRNVIQRVAGRKGGTRLREKWSGREVLGEKEGEIGRGFRHGGKKRARVYSSAKA